MKNRDCIGLAAAVGYVLVPAAMGVTSLVLFGLTRGGLTLAGMSAFATLIALWSVND